MDVGLLLMTTLKRLDPKDFELGLVKFLTAETIADVRAGKSAAEIKRRCAAAQQDFRRRQERFLCYPAAR